MYMMECEIKPWNVEIWSQQVLNGMWIPFFSVVAWNSDSQIGVRVPLGVRKGAPRSTQIIVVSVFIMKFHQVHFLLLRSWLQSTSTSYTKYCPPKGISLKKTLRITGLKYDKFPKFVGNSDDFSAYTHFKEHL